MLHSCVPYGLTRPAVQSNGLLVLPIIDLISPILALQRSSEYYCINFGDAHAPVVAIPYTKLNILSYSILLLLRSGVSSVPSYPPQCQVSFEYVDSRKLRRWLL